MKRWVPFVLLAACAGEPPRVTSPTPATPGPDPSMPRLQPNDPTRRQQDEAAPPRAAGRFGERVYLSNDDSTSLASAQHLLWAVAEGRRVDPATLRPHELLNYFHFDAPEPVDEQTFAVAASAVPTDTGVALALTITATAPPRRPLDLTLVVDRSGSMAEEARVAFVKRGLARMVDQLHPGDRVNVLLFDDAVDVVLDGHVVGRSDPDDLSLAFEAIKPAGTTDLGAALGAAYRLVRAHDTRGRDVRVVLVTDAEVTSGELDPARISEIGRAYDESRVRLAAVGVGRDFDGAVLEALTEKGHGAYVYLGSEKVVDRVFGVGFDTLVHVAADDTRIALDLPDSLGMRRFYGEEASTAAGDVQPVTFYAGTTQVFLQELEVAPGGVVRGDSLGLDITWRDPTTGAEQAWRWEGTVGAALDADRANLDKARALMAWTDLARIGPVGCEAELATWQDRVAAFGGDVETGYLAGLVTGWCAVDERNILAEAR